LVDVPDDEIMAAAKSLGMDPQLWEDPRMRESAAFAGVTYPSRPQASDFFDLDLDVPEKLPRKPVS
jgi:hypothetical protein